MGGGAKIYHQQVQIPCDKRDQNVKLNCMIHLIIEIKNFKYRYVSQHQNCLMSQTKHFKGYKILVTLSMPLYSQYNWI